MLETFTDFEVAEAREMALAVNGGDWNKDYSEVQKVGWCLKARFAMRRYKDA